MRHLNATTVLCRKQNSATELEKHDIVPLSLWKLWYITTIVTSFIDVCQCRVEFSLMFFSLTFFSVCFLPSDWLDCLARSSRAGIIPCKYTTLPFMSSDFYLLGPGCQLLGTCVMCFILIRQVLGNHFASTYQASVNQGPSICQLFDVCLTIAW